MSGKKAVKCGVLQGSTLGPLLLIIFVNDMIHYVKNVSITIHADDTAFPLGGNNVKTISSKINRAANGFAFWYAWLTLNLNKTKVMLFSKRPHRLHSSLKENLQVKIRNHILDTEYKYLGLVLWYEKLNFTSH